MNKRVMSGILLVLVFASLLININFVSAQDSELPATIGNAFKFIIGDVENPLTGEASLLFIKFLIMLIVIIFSFMGLNSLDFFDDHKGISLTLSIIASLLAVRWISGEGIIQMIMLPYSTLGILFSAGLPFVIVFIGIHKGLADQPGIVRRTAWIFFALIFLGLWGTRMGGVTGIVDNFLNGWKDSSYSWYWVYIATAIGALIMAFMDGTIKGFFAKVQADRLKHTSRLEGIAHLKKELKELEDMYSKDKTINEETYKILKKDKEKRLKIISKK